MKLIINGSEKIVEDGLTIPTLLQTLGLDEKPVVIEHNHSALAPSEHASAILSDGDRLEIITIAAGG